MGDLLRPERDGIKRPSVEHDGTIVLGVDSTDGDYESVYGFFYSIWTHMDLIPSGASGCLHILLSGDS